MADPGTVTAVFAAIKAAVNGLKGLKEVELSAKHAEAVDAAMDVMSEAQDSLNAIQSELLDLREENHGLKRTIADHDNWQERLAQYVLVKTAGGAQVYQKGNPPDHHYACPACVEQQQIQILQSMRSMSGRWRCPRSSCHAEYPVDPAQAMPQIHYSKDWRV